MCFVKTKVQKVEAPAKIEEDVVNRKEANASITKNATKVQESNQRNIKTTPQGIVEEATTGKKTLLGE